MSIVAPILLMLSQPVNSGTDALEAMADSVNRLDEVVITATRTPRALKDVPVVTQLITGDEIKRSDATDIQELLTQELPGLEFTYAMSQETSLNMNGFGGSAVLFLVDGERLAGETMDNIDYSRLFLGNAARVEVVKGASSALYGANAVGGVVNLISRESREPWRANVNARYNSAGHEWRTAGNFSFSHKRISSSADIQYVTSDKIQLTSPFDTQSSFQQVWGGNSLNLKERLTLQASEAVKLIARGGYFRRHSHRANYTDRYSDYSGGLKALISLPGEQNLEASYAYDQYDKARFAGGLRTHDHDYSNRQHILHALYTRGFGNHTLIAGADYMNDYLLTYQFADGKTHEQNSGDLYAQFDYNPLSWLNVVGSLRADWYSASGSGAVTSRVATMFKLTHFSLRANYAGGFRAPTLKEMYMSFDMAGIQMIYGNPELKPERSHNFNLAAEYNGRLHTGAMAGACNVTLMGYYNYYDRRITTADFPGDDTREQGAIYVNENGVKVCGLDLSARYKWACGVGLSLHYNYMHTAGRKVDSQFSQPRPHSATWRLDYDHRFHKYYSLYAAISGRWLGKPESSLPTSGAYSMWKFTLQQQVWKGVSVNFVIDNLLGYKPSIYYWNSPPTAGRSYQLGLSIEIDSIFKK